ncbi:LysR substrate-binding domain-containing protein [Puniceibacterium sediminis]|uniref:LysR family transcriptional regulator, glycine cleavage system transcriptional activator n=1 Tax=Puniceibacterium sediminis TaxID=1608407 RepID=A0A238YT09_9RHOB|nr:LysR substrate-binding domain-containing protein [Puniceibacterium sediminis]SNR74416.1 LysR family transcriptional regulator, glycine cleavage system transcriptional activator [Puniceibacterium sediminis]
MSDRLPPMAALRAFEATIRTGSLAKASEELGVTHAAISQQLRILEEHVGVPLLDRTGRKMQSTAAGEILGGALTNGFQKVRDGLLMVRKQAAAMPLRISTTPSFAANWLVPRLHSFSAKNPDIEITIDARCSVIDLDDGSFDAAIRFGTEPGRGLNSIPVVMTGLSVIGAPSLVGDQTVFEPSDLFRFTWLLEPNKEIFMLWLSEKGLDPASHRNRLTIEGAMHYSALLAGQGISIMGSELAGADMKAGRLRILFDDIDTRDDTGYRLVWSPRLERPALRHFVKWLKSQTTADDSEFKNDSGRVALYAQRLAPKSAARARDKP